MRYLIGIDVGTTGAKTILVSEEGEVIASSLEEYPLYTPYPKWAEQDPEDWWMATASSISNVLRESGVDPEDIKGIGLSGQMHGLVLLDKDNKVLRPCIMWCDQRTTEQREWIMNTVGEDLMVQIAGNPALEGFTAPKVIWVKQKEPEIFAKAKTMVLPKDYVRFRLTGEIAMEVSDAAGTVLFDISKRTWSDVILDKLGIPREMMPPCYESIDICGRITKEVAERTGLKAGTPVVGGGADNTCGAVGNGIVRTGRLSASIGSSGVVFCHTDEVKIDSGLRVHTFCHSVPHKWYVMGVTQGAGLSFRWLRDNIGLSEIQVGNLCDISAYDLLAAQAFQAKPGCEGLIFLPYLMGERTPHLDANAKGVFFGLTARHTRADMIRSVMEGVAYSLRDCLEIIKGMGLEIGEIRATGGGARSPLWRQIQADINGHEMVTINVTEGPAFGAAILAGVGAGVYSSIEEATDGIIEITSYTEPIEGNVRLYEEYYEIYRSLYPALKPNFDKVSKIVEKIS